MEFWILIIGKHVGEKELHSALFQGLPALLLPRPQVKGYDLIST